MIIGHLEAAVRRDLSALPGKLATGQLAVAAMMLARRWDHVLPAREVAAVSRELRHVMTDLRKMTPSMTASDKTDQLRARRQVSKVWRDCCEIVLRGRRHKQIDVSNFDLARQPLDDLLDHRHSVASLIISDSAIVDAFVKLSQERATHIWHENSLAYNWNPPIGGKVAITQFLEDLAAVYMAINDAAKQVRGRVVAVQEIAR